MNKINKTNKKHTHTQKHFQLTNLAKHSQYYVLCRTVFTIKIPEYSPQGSVVLFNQINKSAIFFRDNIRNFITKIK